MRNRATPPGKPPMSNNPISFVIPPLPDSNAPETRSAVGALARGGKSPVRRVFSISASSKPRSCEPSVLKPNELLRRCVPPQSVNLVLTPNVPHTLKRIKHPNKGHNRHPGDRVDPPLLVSLREKF